MLSDYPAEYVTFDSDDQNKLNGESIWLKLLDYYQKDYVG